MRGGGVVGERQQQVADRDVLVAEGRHLLFGALNRRDQRPPDRRAFAAVAGSRDGRQRVDGLVGAGRDLGDVGGELAQRRGGEAILLLEQRDEEVLTEHLRVAALGREPLGGRDGLLRLDRETICLHLR